MRFIPSLPLTLMLGASLAGAYGEEEEVVTLDQVPGAVKQAILTAAGGAKLDQIEKESEEGKVVYCAEWTDPDGKTEVEVTIAEDGTVLQTERELKDDEEEDDKQDDKNVK